MIIRYHWGLGIGHTYGKSYRPNTEDNEDSEDVVEEFNAVIQRSTDVTVLLEAQALFLRNVPSNQMVGAWAWMKERLKKI
jgi:hypothetical protein